MPDWRWRPLHLGSLPPDVTKRTNQAGSGQTGIRIHRTESLWFFPLHFVNPQIIATTPCLPDSLWHPTSPTLQRRKTINPVTVAALVPLSGGPDIVEDNNRLQRHTALTRRCLCLAHNEIAFDFSRPVASDA
ncbi:hypothetical protein P8C59_004812 [Phyllachora maydis]|uniref:Uncharacterized protein n=1 Tax=Phyllachora maydis TaxID=1825666 RepID=A0AAD9MBN6_9PEZI|nr:hypothetical protein P8C59_004812 [Phyllachora maydis]